MRKLPYVEMTPVVLRSFKFISLLTVLLLIGAVSFSQTVLRNPDVVVGQLIKVIPSLKDFKAPAGYVPPITRVRDRVVGLNEDNEVTEHIQYTNRVNADPVVQRTGTTNSPNPLPNTPSAITQNFAGMGYTNVAPADPNMCAGPNNIIQMINGGSGSYLKIWDRSGVQQLAQIYMTTLVAGTGYTGNGDPVSIYDQFANRFMLTEFGHAGAGSGINTLIVFVSQTSDPLGAWYVYKFTDNTFFPDYPHWGAWPNVLYASTNDFNTAGTAYLGSSVYAINKTKMVAGDQTAELQRFRLTMNCAPINISGPTAPSSTGTVAHFMYYNDNDYNPNAGAADSIGMINFSPNFAVPASTTLTFAQALVTAPYKSNVCSGRNCVPSASGNGYDALSDRIMNRVMYRSFAGYEALVLNYTVDANAGTGNPAKSGLRWYELRKTGAAWSIYQQSTYAPDADWRWMGSININSKGQIALMYNRSGPTSYASICFTGRNSGDAINTMSVNEVVAKAGTAYGTFANRWGDYNDCPIDVVNDSLFWCTAMYGSAASSWSTQIVQFKIGDCDVQSSSTNLTQSGAAGVPEGQNITYNNTINNSGCVPISNFLLTDTLPTNVSFVSATNGGAYNAGTRVVSWAVNLNAGQTLNYSFTVSINAGAYFATTTSINEPVAGAGIPAGWAATTAVGPSSWISSNYTSHSAPNSLYAIDNATAITDFRVSTTTPVATGTTPPTLTFWHNYNSESGWDGGVVEMSTDNGTTWFDLGNYMTVNGYPSAVGNNNPLAPRPAFTGSSNGWIQTKLRRLPTNQNALFRFRMGSDDNTAAPGVNPGWFVDDILLQNIAEVNIRSSYFNASGTRLSYLDTFTTILPPSGCVGQTVTSQPSNVTTCVGTNASFSIATAGTAPITYQWQESTNGGGSWNTISNGGIYSGATTTTLTLTGVTLGMNNYQYRCQVNGCVAAIFSNAAILGVVSNSIGGSVSPASQNICSAVNTGTFTLSGQTGSVIRWESSVDAGTTWVPIANTTSSLTFNNITQTTWYRAVVQAAGCASANSTIGIANFSAGSSLTILADNGTTLCAGDPTLLTVMEGNFAAGTIATNFAAGNGNYVITFNFRNNNAFPVTLTDISSLAFAAGASNVQAWYSATSTSGSPGAITGPTWIQFGSAAINAIGGTTVQPFMSGLTLSVPAGTTYRILVSCATTGGGFNMGYSTIAAGTYTFSSNGCDIVTGTNIGYGGGAIPSVPGNTPRGFIGSVGFSGGSLSMVTGGTFLWTPAAGLNATNTNPVAASPNTTTTYTVSHNNGAGCIRTASILITINQRPVVTVNPLNVTSCATSTASFTVTGTGTNLTYQWQLSTNGGTTYTNLTNGAPYSGVNTATLTINPVTLAMSNNRYRCVLSGICPPGIPALNVSSGAVLSVNALPTVSVTPNAICGGLPGVNGVLLTASGSANSNFVWSPLAGLYSNATASNAYTGTPTPTVYAAPTNNTVYTVTATNTVTGCSSTATAYVNYTPPKPTVNPPSVTMCAGDPAVSLQITSSLQPSPFTTTYSSGPISIAVPDNNPTGVINTLAVPLPTTANITSMYITLNMTHTWVGDMVYALKAPNNNILNLDYYLSSTGGAGATTGFSNTIISSTGATALSAGSNPYSGTFKPDAMTTTPFGPNAPTIAGYGTANVNSFAGLYSTPNGNWILGAYDGGAGDVGTITSWSLTFNYLYGPPSAGIWTPNGAGSGLFTDPAATLVYTGTPANQVYTRPATSTTYSVTVSTPVSPAIFTNATSGFAANNGNYTISFNVKNNNAYSITMTGIASQTAFVGTANVQAWYNATAINGAPSAINNANGWFQFGAATITGTAALQTFMSGLTLTIPANSTYGIIIQAADGVGGYDLTYSTIAAGTYTFSQGGVDIITGNNIGYGGVAIPGAPTFTPRGFIGSITYTNNDPSLFSCTSGPTLVPVTVNTPIAITVQPANTTVCTDKTATFSVTATGTTPTYQWQVSTNGGTSYTSISNGGVYSGATSATLTITAPPVSMNGNMFRCAIAGAAPCGTVFSAGRTLTVNPLPTVVISAAPYLNLLPGLRSTISSTSNPAAAIYTWLRNGIVVPGAITGSILVDVDGFGTYSLRVTDVNGCVNTSNAVTIADSTSGRVFIYPNPNSGQFQVRYNPIHNNVIPRGINVYNSRGQRVSTKKYTLGMPFARMDVDLSIHGSGVYWIEVVDVDDNRLAIGRVEVLR